MKRLIHLTVNDRKYEVAVEPNRTLVDLLRYQLGLTGTKKGCDLGDCGSCTVIMDGKPVNSCLVLAVQADGKTITTIEGLETGGRLHPVQRAFVDKGAIQCGFCSSGMILSAKNLLDRNPHPSEMEIRHAISGNLCRCTGYQKIIEAVKSAAAIDSVKPQTRPRSEKPKEDTSPAAGRRSAQLIESETAEKNAEGPPLCPADGGHGAGDSGGPGQSGEALRGRRIRHQGFHQPHGACRLPSIDSHRNGSILLSYPEFSVAGDERETCSYRPDRR